MFEPPMSGEYFYGAMRKRAPAARFGKIAGPPVLRGTRATGRIARLLVGQGHGFIRLTDEGEVFFHRADVEENTAFNDLRIGDTVTFELFQDTVSGARALHVARRDPAR
jgi:cold shock CspA family protein